MLGGAPSLMAVTVLEELRRRHPERFADAALRTLQRRVSQWRAEHGGEREIYFAQGHPPGRLGLSGFTVADELDISPGGLPFPRRLYQFALAHSGWRHARVVLGGESFQSLAARLQDALWMAEGVAQEHRTDSLSAALNNLAERQELTARYQALCRLLLMSVILRIDGLPWLYIGAAGRGQVTLAHPLDGVIRSHCS